VPERERWSDALPAAVSMRRAHGHVQALHHGLSGRGDVCGGAGGDDSGVARWLGHDVDAPRSCCTCRPESHDGTQPQSSSHVPITGHRRLTTTPLSPQGMENAWQSPRRLEIGASDASDRCVTEGGAMWPVADENRARFSADERKGTRSGVGGS